MTFVANLPMVVPNITYNSPDISQLLHLLEYRRYQGSGTQREFCKKHLRPVMGYPDKYGNYVHIIGEKPRVAFMAHHDTVHHLEGHQRVLEIGNFVYLPASSRSNCLGADCTTGVWLILHMIKCGVEGVYVVHAAEECGGKGADFIVNSQPEWFKHVEIAVSFDRKGYDSVVTHQAGMRTASDTFARALSKELKGQYAPDSTGVFTDSQVYSSDISECTNISVGYFNQHSRTEKQDISFAYNLAEALINVDWKGLPAFRDPHSYESKYHGWYDKYAPLTPSQNANRHGKGLGTSSTIGFGGYPYGNDYSDDPYEKNATRLQAESMQKIVEDNPYLVAKMLVEFGVNRETLIDELGLWEQQYEW